MMLIASGCSQPTMLFSPRWKVVTFSTKGMPDILASQHITAILTLAFLGHFSVLNRAIMESQLFEPAGENLKMLHSAQAYSTSTSLLLFIFGIMITGLDSPVMPT